MQSDKRVYVWDIFVRIFHWSLVSLFLISYLTGEEWMSVHSYSGYAIGVLLVLRILWGLVGSRHARFGDFLHGPGRVREYLQGLFSGRAEHFLGHNPAGGWMVVALMISLAATCWSGMEAYAVEGHGPLAGAEFRLISTALADGYEHDDEDDDDEHREHGEKDEFWEEVHEFMVNFTLFLVFFHLLGVIASSLLHGENLLRAMINGYKKSPSQN